MHLVFVVFLVAIYLLPTIFEQVINGNIRSRIIMINVLVGWTIIGWAYAFVLVFQERNRRRKNRFYYYL